MNRWIGRWLVVVALLHTLFALVVFHTPLSQIVQAGVFDTVGRDPTRGAVVWFLLFGAVALPFGIAIDALEKAKVRLPAAIGICLLLVAILGVVLPRNIAA